MQSFSTRFLEEGKQIGKEIDKEISTQIGIQLGEATMLLFQLEQKFGSVPDAVRQRVEQADPDTLLRWSGRVLNEDSIDAVLR